MANKSDSLAKDNENIIEEITDEVCPDEEYQCISGWDNNGKPGNQVATKSLPSSEIFGKNPAFIILYVNLKH